MTPSQIFRAALPIRSIASPLTLARPTLLPSTYSLTQPLRHASTETASPEQHISPEEPTITSPPPSSNTAKPRLQKLQPPAELRKYAYAVKAGTVVSVGRMQGTVTVLHRHNAWDKHIRKFYPQETRFLVADPQNSLREGDVIEFSSGAPKSRHDRPAVLSREERQAQREQSWAAKYLRRESRRLGEEIDIKQYTSNLMKEGVQYSDAELIRLYHANKDGARVGRIKSLVQQRTAAMKEAQRPEKERAREEWLQRKATWESHEAARQQAKQLEEARQE
ncbi:unnamed protein product [Penicillium pancosmium]